MAVSPRLEGPEGLDRLEGLTLTAFPPLVPFPPVYTSAALRTTRTSAQRFRRLIGRVSMMATVSPMPAVLFSSCTMNFDVRRMVLPYSPCRTCHSTATTMLFCILLLTTTPTFSDFSAITFFTGLGPDPSD